jgi:hypothetical protein
MLTTNAGSQLVKVKASSNNQIVLAYIGYFLSFFLSFFGLVKVVGLIN